MNRQSQWLFEAPPVLESASHSNQEYYSNPEWEGEWESQEASPYGLGEEEWEQPPGSSPRGQTIRETVSGFSRYSNAIPPQERAKIARIAQIIVQSYRSGQPIRTVRLVGHADRDIQRGASFENKISGDRALAVQKVLIAAIKNPSIASQISWQRVSAGASRLIVQNSRTEGDRLRNRRVDILLPISCNALPVYGQFMSRAMLASTAQRCGGTPPCPTPQQLQARSGIINFTDYKFIVAPECQTVEVELTAIWRSTACCEPNLRQYNIELLGLTKKSATMTAGIKGLDECIKPVKPQTRKISFQVKPGAYTLRVHSFRDQSCATLDILGGFIRFK